MRHNEKILNGLKRAAQENRLHHAYILSGAASAAKVDCVERFAASIFASGGGSNFGDEAADQERILARIRQKNHPDFSRIEESSEGEKEGKKLLEQVRELPRTLSFPPLEAGRRIILIPEAASLGDSSFNSILKILEEPPGHTMFFLICRDPGDLLQTIVSRCQVLRFAPLSDDELLGFLGERTNPGQSQALLGWSEGALERAELLLGEERALPLQRAACEHLLELWEVSPRIPSSAASWVEQIESGLPEQVVLDSWEVLLRDLAFVQAGAGPSGIRFREFHPRLAGIAANGGEAAAREVPERASSINRFRVHRRFNSNLRLDFAALLSELQIFSIGKSGASS